MRFFHVLLLVVAILYGILVFTPEDDSVIEFLPDGYGLEDLKARLGDKRSLDHNETRNLYLSLLRDIDKFLVFQGNNSELKSNAKSCSAMRWTARLYARSRDGTYSLPMLLDWLLQMRDGYVHGLRYLPSSVLQDVREFFKETFLIKVMKNTTEDAVLQIAETIERAVDDEMERLDNLDDDELLDIRNKRLRQLKEMEARREAWIKKGHGQFSEVTDPKEFFQIVEQSERVVVNFMRRSTPRCAILERHMRAIASTNFETRFCYVDVERIPVLAERFNVMMLPTLMLIENKNTFHSIIGFDEFGGVDDFSTTTVKNVLSHYGMLNDRGMFSADQSNE